MDYTAKEVLQSVKENDVKFIRRAFCDIFGTLKNVSIMPGELPPAFSQGITVVHVNMSLSRGGMNLFKECTAGHSAEAESFMAGVLHRAAEITAFANLLINSYSRFGCFEAPKYITWSHQNRSQLVRIPAASDFVRRMIPAFVLEKYCETKREEYQRTPPYA